MPAEGARPAGATPTTLSCRQPYGFLLVVHQGNPLAAPIRPLLINPVWTRLSSAMHCFRMLQRQDIDGGGHLFGRTASKIFLALYGSEETVAAMVVPAPVDDQLAHRRNTFMAVRRAHRQPFATLRALPLPDSCADVGMVRKHHAESPGHY